MFGDDLILDNNVNKLYVTLGQFSIIRLERDIQLLMPAYDICMPAKECSCGGADGAEDPCDMFERFEFPVEEFFPPRRNLSGQNGGCGCRGDREDGGRRDCRGDREDGGRRDCRGDREDGGRRDCSPRRG